MATASHESDFTLRACPICILSAESIVGSLAMDSSDAYLTTRSKGSSRASRASSPDSVALPQAKGSTGDNTPEREPAPTK